MSKQQIQTGIAVVVALVVVGFFIGGNFFSSAMPQQSADTPAGVVVQDQIIGQGAEARAGDTVVVNYTGKLQDGTVFDTTVGRGPLRPFILGAGQVIPGWDQGLVGMKAGGTRTLIIPPEMAYGAQGIGPIPPNATLTFEVELLSVKR
ncbi:MAG: FKBP-type peptidyl-prolyl cis-trans isomerase [Patescibacteria group bacterium]